MSTTTAETLVHLIYIHGFQGDDTSFQAFPKDLQQYLTDHLTLFEGRIRFQSSLYPTYKSRKPISEATANFLAWLKTQPPGPIILLAHSMGGLLAADAATDASLDHGRGTARERRILGVIAFDVPYLGMHPHVVVSGLASLGGKQGEEGNDKELGKPVKKEAELNKHKEVKIVDRQVTEDWDTFKRKIDAQRSPSRSPLPSPTPSTHSARSLFTSLPSTPPATKSQFLTSAMTLLSSAVPVEGKLGKWLTKHAEDPLSAGRRFVVEYFQFGSSMFDPPGLRERYENLVRWGSEDSGLWVNYWTQVPAALVVHDDENGADGVSVGSLSTSSTMSMSSSDVASMTTTTSSNSQTSPPSSPKSGSPSSSSPKSKSKKKHKSKPHHFIVLPDGPVGSAFGGFEHWEPVVIAGVKDEVAAHTGLFIRGSNLEYEGLVERVGARVIGWTGMFAA
uniref:AB hydrolase-1 domain-containing protein n=1 Tax=Mycena chlorophos TaxID=658473 RepID=A0ABQ0LWN1_MYCCL|nr:predicted protein [Mycena chlorophos]